MFSLYQQAVETAISTEKSCSDDFNLKREQLALQIKEKLKNELDIMNETSLSDYSPIVLYNEIAELRKHFDDLKVEEKQRKDNIKHELHCALDEISDREPVMENFYKVINNATNDANCVCRVWFSLVDNPDLNIEAGDPYRVEWINYQNGRNCDPDKNCIACYSEKKSKEEVLKIPQFSSSGVINLASNLHNPNNWGDNSNQLKWWKEWVDRNKPF